MICFQQVIVRSILFALLYMVSVESLRFLEEPTDTYVYVTEKATLTCRFDGFMDHHSIVWAKDNTYISFNDFIQLGAIISPFDVIFNRGEGLCSIEIQHAEVSDSGFYICGVEYGNGQYKWSSRAALTIYEFFRREPTNIGVYEGGTAVLPCTANILRTGLSLLWMKESETLTFQHFIADKVFGRIEIIGNYTAGFYNISIKNATLSDTGSYRCGLELESGTTEWSREGMMTVLKRVDPVRNDISVRPGDEIQLTCQLAPFVQNQNLVWAKDMTMITWNEFVEHSSDQYSRLSIDMKNYSYDLQVMLVENTDSGLYKCGVEFPNGLYHWITEVLLTVIAVSSHSLTTTRGSTAGQAESVVTSQIDVSTISSLELTFQDDRTRSATTEAATLVVTPTVTRNQNSGKHSTVRPELTTVVPEFKSVGTVAGTAQNMLTSVAVSLPQSKTYSLIKLTTPMSTATYPPRRTSRSSTRSTTTHSMRDVTIQKPSREGEGLLVYIGVIVIITLAFVTLFLTCVILLMIRKEKRKKKLEENSPLGESTDNMRAQSSEAGYEIIMELTDIR